ncbi:MAG TPA: DUF2071 domain-containing protein [Actinomycetota bacterium]|nr:DUF2071 domain-containing protein [Actinomycetota bacterium]
MSNGPPIFAINVTNFALITYAVPAARIEAHLPRSYDLDVFEGPEGRTAFVSTTCFCNHDFRLAGVGYPRHTFNESTYRTYVTHKGRKGIYFFGRYLGTRRAWASQRPIARHTYTAKFEIATESSGGTYTSYTCHAASDQGETSFALQAIDQPDESPPFATGYELTQFLTYRLHGFYTDSLGFQGHMPVGHPRMNPVAGKLSAARFTLWNELGVVTDDEVLDPYSVLVIAEVPFTLYAPRFLV